MAGFTFNKGSRKSGYLGQADMVEAYLWWYLPLNLLKLATLLPRLELAKATQITDYGCGPWTLPLAVWFLLPQWHAVPLGWTLIEPESAALEAGHRLFEFLAGSQQLKTWRFTQIKDRLGTQVRRKADLVMASHALNEWPETEDTLARLLLRDAQPEARLLIVEPGTRLAVRRLTQLRQMLIDLGAAPIAPCPHSGECPAPGQSVRDRFCHFSVPEKLPNWMQDLARQLGVQKDSNTLSYLYFQHKAVSNSNAQIARVISGPIKLDEGKSGCYLCSREGLLVGVSDEALWGNLVCYRKDQGIDAKTHRPRVSLISRKEGNFLLDTERN